MKRKGRWTGLLLLAGSALSVADVPLVRSVEQLLAPLLVPGEALLAAALPTADPAEAEVLAALRGLAGQAYGAWAAEVLGSAPVSGSGREGLLVSVLERRPREHQLVLAVPPGAVPPDAAVTHRGALLGFVTRLSVDGTRATVSLLGNPEARPVAAEWRVAPDARPVSFLLTGTGRDEGWTMRVEARSSTVAPPAGQLAWTRDVSRLGDPLPPHLTVGQIVPMGEDAPGGGPTSDDDALRVAALVDAGTLDLVTVEVRPGAEPDVRRRVARVYASCRSPDAWRLDVGSRDGVVAGDWVVQDGLYIGRVAVVSPLGSLVDVALPPGVLLVMSPEGEVVPCRPDAASWPPGWQPARGDLVAAGRLGTGGLVIGRVAALRDERLVLDRPQPDPARAVEVVGP